MAERYVCFNVPELLHTAARAVGRDRCVDIRKFAEGGFNKIFLLTMDDGYEVIARIPTPIAGPAHYTTASEVATMDFLRTRLNIPTPRVFAWASRVGGENVVGAEYIIMEKMQGESLASRRFPRRNSPKSSKKLWISRIGSFQLAFWNTGAYTTKRTWMERFARIKQASKVAWTFSLTNLVSGLSQTDHSGRRGETR